MPYILVKIRECPSICANWLCYFETRLSFNFHDRKRISSDVYFRHPLFGLQSSAERTPARVAQTVERACCDRGKSERPTKIDLASRWGVRDTGNLWHAISHRMKTWCRHVDLTGATQMFRLFHRILYGFHTRAYAFLHPIRTSSLSRESESRLPCSWHYIKDRSPSSTISYDVP